MQKHSVCIALLLTTVACGGATHEPLPFADVFAVEETVRLATDPDDPLGRAGDVVAWNGRFAISDPLAKNVKVFAQDGTLDATIGRLGDGPGEFRSPTSLGVDARGRLTVLDQLHGRVSTFTRDGEYVDAFQLHGGAMGGMAVFSDGTRLVIGALLADDDEELRSPYLVHIFDLRGERTASFGRRPTPRSRAESSFIGTSLDVIGDEVAIWGTLGHNTLLAHSLNDGSVHLADSIRLRAFNEPEWTEAPETDPEMLDWVVNYHLLTAVIGGPNLALVRFQSGDPRVGEEWFRYALVAIDPLRTIAVTGRTPHYIQRWINDELLGVTIEADGEAYLTRYRFQEEAIPD